MIGGGCTDKDKGLGKEMARAYDGHRGIIGRARERERDGQTERQRNVHQPTVIFSDDTVAAVCFNPTVRAYS